MAARDEEASRRKKWRKEVGSSVARRGGKGCDELLEEDELLLLEDDELLLLDEDELDELLEEEDERGALEEDERGAALELDERGRDELEEDDRRMASVRTRAVRK